MAHKSPPDLALMSSSSPIPQSGSIRPKRPPTVTPKRFNRFFNPSSSRSTSSCSSRALKDLTRSGINRVNGLHDSRDEKMPNARPAKRLKYLSLERENQSSDAAFSSSPPMSSPCNQYEVRNKTLYPKPIVRAKQARPVWETAYCTPDFCSEPAGRHEFHTDLPYCTTACNTNSLVAVGTEHGHVRILESSQLQEPSFGKTWVSFRTHHYAVVDMAFSSDDKWLAIASGGRYASIVDMQTQDIIHMLSDSPISPKQIEFQPGNDHIVAACFRNGEVVIWDLRCKGSPVYRTGQRGILSGEPLPYYPPSYKTFYSTHSDISLRPVNPLIKKPKKGDGMFDHPPEPAVTAMAFLPHSPNHFITASDSNSLLRVWDMRGYVRGPLLSRLPNPHPVSTSTLIPSHVASRRYGITSLALSTDNARLYAVCFDHTVHVYSAPHLILGQSPSLHGHFLDGAAPMHVLRHDELSVNSFYIRGRVRPASPMHPELLAVGSSTGNVVLFATDYNIPKRKVLVGDELGNTYSSAACGTALVRGHDLDVTSLTWTNEGNLVTCGDDRVARVWRENADRARDLRYGGEGEGRRWKCGWRMAEPGENWDRDEDFEGDLEDWRHLEETSEYEDDDEEEDDGDVAVQTTNERNDEDEREASSSGASSVNTPSGWFSSPLPTRD